MNRRNLVYGLLLFVLLILFWLSGTGHHSTNPHFRRFSLVPSSVYRIVIKRAETAIRLQRDDSVTGWQVVRYAYPAGLEFIQGLFQVFSRIKAKGPVSDNPGKQSEYGLDRSGLGVEFKDSRGKSLLHVIVGKLGPAYTGNFFRLADEVSVYLTDANLRYPLNRPEYRNLEVFDSSPGRLKVLQFSDKGMAGKIVLEKGGEVIKERIMKVRVNDFVDDGGPEKYHLAEADYHFLLTFENGRKQGLSVSSKGEGSQLYALKDGSRQVLLVSGMLIESLVSDLKRFNRPVASSPDAPLR